MRTLLLAALLAAPALPSPVRAAETPATVVEAVQTCLGDSTSGRDRKLLAKWIFLAMGAHPELKSLSSATAQDQEQTSRDFADLVMRLMTVDCKGPMQAMMASDGDVSAAMKLAFSYLGRVAMQELMNDKSVDGTISQFGKYIDEGKLNAALGARAAK